MMDMQNKAECTAMAGAACELMTLAQAAVYLGLGDNGNPGECVRWLCRKRAVKYAKLGKRIMFRREWLDAYIEAQAVPALRKWG